MIFSTKTMHASTRKQTIWRPYCQSEIVMIYFFSTISPLYYAWFQTSTAVLTKTYLSFKPTLFGLIPLVCFFAVYISSRHRWYRLNILFKIKSTDVHATEVSALFQSNYEALLSLQYIHFHQSMKMAFMKPLDISQNTSTKCSIIGPSIYVWPVNGNQLSWPANQYPSHLIESCATPIMLQMPIQARIGDQIH